MNLVGTVAMLMVVSLFGFAYLKLGAYESDAAQARWEQVQAFWKAEEALSRTRALMQKIQEPDGAAGATLDADGERFTAKTRVTKIEDRNFYAYEILAEVFFRDEEDRPFFTLRSVEKPKTLADFFILFHYAGEYPDECPYFDTGDRVDGHLHSNTFVPITGSPLFMGPVTTGDPFPGYKPRPFGAYRAPDNIENTGEVFEIPNTAELLRKNARHIALPGNLTAVLQLTGGGYNLRARDPNNENYLKFVEAGAFSDSGGGLFISGDAEVYGVVKGKVTIGASGDIYITDDLVYADADPHTGEPPADSKNVLGLIAEQNVRVKQVQKAPYIGRGITIDAAILAMHYCFEVVNYGDYMVSLGPMRLWGNVVQYQRGSVGRVRFRATMELGYLKDWHYDGRLQTLPPPFFPPMRDGQGHMRFRTVYWERPHA